MKENHFNVIIYIHRRQGFYRSGPLAKKEPIVHLHEKWLKSWTGDMWWRSPLTDKFSHRAQRQWIHQNSERMFPQKRCLRWFTASTSSSETLHPPTHTQMLHEETTQSPRVGTTSNALQKKDSLKPEARAAWARTERDSGSTSPSDPCSLRTEKEAIDTQIGDKQAGRQAAYLFIYWCEGGAQGLTWSTQVCHRAAP